jgi:hypothetical protein
VLRRVGHALIPFIERRLGESVARWQYVRAANEWHAPDCWLAVRSRRTPLDEALLDLQMYFRRLEKAGQLRVSDAYAAAIALLGALQAYVLVAKGAPPQPPPVPRERYLDVVVEVWTCGLLPPPARH